MEIPIGRLRLSITLSHAEDRRRRWDELVAVGMDDRELARLNQANGQPPDYVVREWQRLVYGLDRRL